MSFVHLPRVSISVAIFWLVMLLATARAHASGALRLDDSQDVVTAWPAVTLLSDPGKSLDADQALGRLGEFRPPEGAESTLGLRHDAVWVRVPIDAVAGGRWILDIDYPPLNRIDVHLARDGRWEQQETLGNLQPYSQRSLQSRTPAMALSLEDGAHYELLLRVETQGPMVMPIRLSRPAAFHSGTLRELWVQGLLAGLGTGLLLYSLLQWLSMGEKLFGMYALMISGSLVFSLIYFGIGTTMIWPDSLWIEQHGAGLATLIGLVASFLLYREVLADENSGRWFSPVMRAGAALAAVTAAAFALDLITMHTVVIVLSLGGSMPILLSTPAAWRRMRGGDQVGSYLLLAWLVHVFSIMTTVGMANGHIGLNFWTQHAFQFGSTLNMLIVMHFLGVSTATLRRTREQLHALAHTDALTGLANRRALMKALDDTLRTCAEGRLVAVFLLDLNRFKEVNDHHGHEIGDELLTAVGQRLKRQMHSCDLVARLGGDEFVVIASRLKNAAQADSLAQDLHRAFDEPFQLGRHLCSVGLSLGHALAPVHGLLPQELMKHADTAMYRAKGQR